MTSNGSSQTDLALSTENVDGSPLTDDGVTRVLEIINRDSGVQPQRYLTETTVPHGGE